MKDYTLIKKTWKGKLISHLDASVSLEAINMSEENKHLLEYAGLPLEQSNGHKKLLPFSFFPSLAIQGKEFYLLGDIGSITMGVSFIGLDKVSEEIYNIYLDNNDKSTYSFINQSLYQYLMCFAYYTNFITTDYPEVSPESCKPSVYRGKIQVRADYQQLKDNLTSIDPKAMANPSNFWASEVFGIQVNGWGDYFSDVDYDNFEPLTPEEQESIDKTGFPF